MTGAAVGGSGEGWGSGWIGGGAGGAAASGGLDGGSGGDGPGLLLPYLPGQLTDSLGSAAYRLAEHSWWLLGLGAAGAIATSLLPSPSILRLRRLGSAEHTRAPASAGRRYLLLWAARLRSRLGFALGRVQARRRRAVVELCRVLAAELRAGREPGPALESAVAELDPESAGELAPLCTAARSGHDIVPPLRRLATQRGAGGLAYLAACLRVAAGTGARAADIVDRLAESLAADEAQRRELGAQLAGPRATAVLLSALPVLGLAMASALGGSPLAFLFTTPTGLLCLAGGLTLDAAGLFWTHRMVRGVLSETE
ncbi:hypothetical protein GCM10027570_32850 [Streptomonospora sediminis]